MPTAARFATNLPGPIVPHSAHRAVVHPYCALQELDTDDLHRDTGDPLRDDTKELLARTGPESFRLYVQFVHSHGLSKGQITTFSNANTNVDSMGGSSERNGARRK